jgi:hypothetical protein
VHSLSSLGALVLAASCFVACAAGGVGDGDGDFNVEQGGDDAAATDSGTADVSSSNPGYGSDASVHPADANAPSTGQDSGGFPPPTGGDAGTTTIDSSAPDTGTTTHDSGTTFHDSGSTQSGCVAPDTASSCTACMTSGETCQNNGCYNGYYCDTSTNKCYAQSSCP